MKSRRSLSFIMQVGSSVSLYWVILKICKVPFAVFNYYFIGKNSYLTQVPAIKLEDLLFSVTILQLIFTLIKFIFFLGCYFPLMNFIKRTFLSPKKRPMVPTTSNADMGAFFAKSHTYFSTMKQQKRYTIPQKDELPNEKMHVLTEKKQVA
ncbi:hypothetical protein MX629_02420 [Carnobacterium divergens]|uniref:Conjugal transfer protein n=1 Tax=Carnobacterium divergens TaxID=2748 RepID=A0AAW8R6D0_CARDV|nr:hypothetical protein [Carnobacterium divergens]MDT1957274.1 hypothetical protein [Carnobacterium divergens]MDT1973244.1 hypothetical protein [Carnobacterium divergens]